MQEAQTLLKVEMAKFTADWRTRAEALGKTVCKMQEAQTLLKVEMAKFTADWCARNKALEKQYIMPLSI